MKKFFAALLALCMIAALCPAAWADGDGEAQRFSKVAVCDDKLYYAVGQSVFCYQLDSQGIPGGDVQYVTTVDGAVWGLAAQGGELYFYTGDKIYRLRPQDSMGQYDIHQYEGSDGGESTLTGTDPAAGLSLYCDLSRNGWSLPESDGNVFLDDGTIYAQVTGDSYDPRDVIAIEDGRVREAFRPNRNYMHPLYSASGLSFGTEEDVIYWSFKDQCYYYLSDPEELWADSEYGFNVVSLGYFSRAHVGDKVYMFGVSSNEVIVCDVETGEWEYFENQVYHQLGYADIFAYDGKIYFLNSAEQDGSYMGYYDPSTRKSSLLKEPIYQGRVSDNYLDKTCVYDGKLYWLEEEGRESFVTDLKSGGSHVFQLPEETALLDAVAVHTAGWYAPTHIELDHYEGDAAVIHLYSRTQDQEELLAAFAVDTETLEVTRYTE